MTAPLTDRERQVLEAVIETYVQTAEPAGSRTIATRHQLGLSPATIRNTMSDLEDKGYLYHPHTSAGRIPTDLAYRVYVDFLMRPPAVAPAQAQHIRSELEGQRAAIEAHAEQAGLIIIDWFYDAAVKGADAVTSRPGFVAMLDRIAHNGVRTIIIESPDRFARDLAVQLAGHDFLRNLGVTLIPATAPDFFVEDTPTAVLVRQVLGAIAQFEKANLVAKLKAARDRKIAAGSKCGGRRSYAERDPNMVALAKEIKGRGGRVSHAHLRWLNPFPRNTGDVLRAYDRVLVPEMNLGQLLKLVRAEFLVDAQGYNRVRGTPFKASEIAAAIEGLL